MRPVIISIPHASTAPPEDLEGKILLNDHDLLSYSDLYTEEIFAIPNVYVVKANVSRVFVDVNRAPDDITEEYEQGEEGVVVHTTWDGKKIYKKEPTVTEVAGRVKMYHDSFHDEIDSYIPAAQFLIDCHSYLPVGPPLKPDAGKPRADVCIGNVNYTTCTRKQTVFFREFFERHGFSVSINFPYQGKYILGRHCHRKRIPHFLVPGVQVELNQKLYSDPETLAPNQDRISELNQLMQKLVDEFLEKFEK